MVRLQIYGYIALLYVEKGIGDFLGSLWVNECFNTYERLRFVRHLNHLSINVIYIGITILDICKYCRYIQQKELLFMCLFQDNNGIACGTYSISFAKTKLK